MKNLKALLSLCLLLALAGASAAQAEDKAVKLVIVKAEYGDLPDGTKADVTDKVKALANADGLNVAASNENFGDPVEGTAKKLKIEYTLDEQKLERTVNEGETVEISTKPAKLKILKAFYGDLPDGTKTDVTLKVQAMLKGDALSVGATNENFGDPVEGTAKKLKVEFTFEGGASKSKEANENDTLTISNKGE